MEGFARTLASSLRPAENVALPLPRRVLRHLVTRHRLGPGSRVMIGGDEADGLAAYLGRLGINAATVSAAPLKAGRYDAAIWLESDAAPAGDRSLLSSAALRRTAALLAALRPGRSFLFVSHIERPARGHKPVCLERHLAPFAGRSRLAFFADRRLSGWFSGVRPGYAVASLQAPAATVEPILQLKHAITAASAACCDWAAATSRARKAA